MPAFQFPAGFLWGAAAASYQIEGAVAEDGRGPSVWDTFCLKPGAINNGDSGAVACDHYHRYKEDVALMASLGLHAYRFSIAWPRVQPTGRGPANEKGLAFYDRLVDELLAKGVTPCATCFHWDTPQALEDKGGWQSRDTVDAFADYCGILAKRLGDRVGMWFTLNEIPVVWQMGYTHGYHAPGLKLARKQSHQVCHHLLMAHGAGSRALRARLPTSAQVGLVHNPSSYVPFHDSPRFIEAARAAWRQSNDWCLMPVFRGEYPAHGIESLGPDMPDVRDGDLALINQPGDFIGLNIYSAYETVHPDWGKMHLGPGFPKTDMGWDITPDCLYWSARFLHEAFAPKAIHITENGCAYPDAVNTQGRVDDWARVEYLRQHLKGVHRATAEGIPLRGYFQWSILDNFEWAYGYQKRFGIVHVNYETQVRTPKASALWYKEVIAANAL